MRSEACAGVFVAINDDRSNLPNPVDVPSYCDQLYHTYLSSAVNDTTSPVVGISAPAVRFPALSGVEYRTPLFVPMNIPPRYPYTTLGISPVGRSSATTGWSSTPAEVIVIL